MKVMYKSVDGFYYETEEACLKHESRIKYNEDGTLSDDATQAMLAGAALLIIDDEEFIIETTADKDIVLCRTEDGDLTEIPYSEIDLNSPTVLLYSYDIMNR